MCKLTVYHSNYSMIEYFCALQAFARALYFPPASISATKQSIDQPEPFLRLWLTFYCLGSCFVCRLQCPCQVCIHDEGQQQQGPLSHWDLCWHGSCHALWSYIYLFGGCCLVGIQFLCVWSLVDQFALTVALGVSQGSNIPLWTQILSPGAHWRLRTKILGS